MHKRKNRKINSYVRFKLANNPSDFYREQVMLFLHWRNEYDDLINVNCQEVYQSNFSEIQRLYYSLIK